MTLRELMMVGLRILAVWIIVSSLLGLPTLAYGILETAALGARFGGVSTRGSWAFVVSPLLTVVTHAGMGVLLFAVAPRIARLTCRSIGPDSEPRRLESIRAGELYHVATFLMGIYVLVQAISPGAQAAVAMVEQMPPSNYTHWVVTSALLLAVGGALVLGAQGIAAFLTNLRHDPDNVPAQQFSLRLILLLVVGIAMLLVVIRTLVG